MSLIPLITIQQCSIETEGDFINTMDGYTDTVNSVTNNCDLIVVPPGANSTT